ncbi:Nif3-like dinuclear metal center hexameric protein [Coprothermobacter platensis]|uniref:Nif3-like dinuclear metal center hexameric protein n=1 Tax=Coprothermobacter platensis TaxID=108819 RepID=UPI0003636017|nr:Nif3-like dinuclear metal center hexameric protein [Coprothermobacter platensis]
MNTEEIMELAMQMSELDVSPSDSSIYVEGNDIKRVLFGIDIGPEELLWAKQQGFDLVIAHHPPSAALRYEDTYKRHATFMMKAGIPAQVAHDAIADKLLDIHIQSKTENFTRVIGMAKLLNMPFMNIHAPIDEITRNVFQKTIDSVLPADVDEIVNAMNNIEPFPHSHVKVEQVMGNPHKVVDKLPVLIGAYTNGGYMVAKTWYQQGFPGVVYMHINAPDFEKLRREFPDNVLILTGHMPGDYVGALIFLRELKKRGLDVLSIGFPELL